MQRKRGRSPQPLSLLKPSFTGSRPLAIARGLKQASSRLTAASKTAAPNKKKLHVAGDLLLAPAPQKNRIATSLSRSKTCLSSCAADCSRKPPPLAGSPWGEAQDPLPPPTAGKHSLAVSSDDSSGSEENDEDPSGSEYDGGNSDLVVESSSKGEEGLVAFPLLEAQATAPPVATRAKRNLCISSHSSDNPVKKLVRGSPTRRSWRRVSVLLYHALLHSSRTFDPPLLANKGTQVSAKDRC